MCLVDLSDAWRIHWPPETTEPAAAGSTSLASVVAADWLTLASLRTQRAELETATLHSNAALASAQARAVLAAFEKFASEAARVAAEPELRAFLSQGEVGTVSVLQQTVERGRYDSVGVFGRDGLTTGLTSLRYTRPDA